MKKTFEYDTYLYVDIDTSQKVLSWYGNRRGDEWGKDQTLSEFISSGPIVGLSEIPRPILMKMISFLKLDPKSLSWVDFEKSISLFVNGKPITLYDDAHLVSHAENSIQDIVQKIGLGKEKYFEKFKVKAGILAKDFDNGKCVFAKDTEIEFYESGKIKYGNLAKDCFISKRKMEKGNFVWFTEDGEIDFIR